MELKDNLAKNIVIFRKHLGLTQAELAEKLKGRKNVEVYLNDKNLGFGGGNNKGIEIIRKEYDPEYLVLSNNDIVLLEKDFCKKRNFTIFVW